MNPSQVYLYSPSQTLLPPPVPHPPSESSQRTSPKHPVSCIEPGLVTRFIHDIIHVSMPFSQISPPSPSPTESVRLIYTSVSLLLSRTTREAHAPFGGKIGFPDLANTFLIYLESWKESKHRYLKILTSLVRLCVPGGSVVKNLPANAEDMGSLSGFGRSLAEGNRQRTAVILPGKFDGQKNMVGHGIAESNTTQ